jgi:hypothetical protein
MLLVGCFGIGAAGESRGQEATLPAESSFITKLADEAIDADGAEARLGRKYSRSVFAHAFLGGYATPGSTLPVNPALSSSRINGKGWSAGQTYREIHPESVARVLREYGYTEFEGTGTWTVGFEAGAFRPDNRSETSNTSSPKSCWYLAFIHTPDLDAQLARLLPGGIRFRGATLRVRATGYVSPVGRFGHFGVCERQLHAVSVAADGAENGP